MVEDSVATFEALCAHQDPAKLAADQDYISQYEEIVQLYANFASKDVAKTGKTPISWPVAIRFRKSGLRALKAVASRPTNRGDVRVGHSRASVQRPAAAHLQAGRDLRVAERVARSC